MMKTTILSGLSLGALLSFAASTASAASASYYLDQNNIGLASANYLQVTISDSASVLGDIDFSIQTLSAFDALSKGPNFGMQSFAFNFDSSLTISAANITNIDPLSWTAALGSFNVSEFGRFDIEATGTGSSRTELLTFSISGVSGDTIGSYAMPSVVKGSKIPELFAAHVADFDNGNSAYFAGSSLVVPVPAAAGLFGSGLLALAGLIKRRK